ncbi:hypothetical protein E3J85_01880 [Patescibacteria group bacterium]|nr:MAG: hypothetical protein E3J85_01880 [Patescibacteria group bacterium]
MELEDLLQFIDKEDKRLKEYYEDSDNQKTTLVRSTKLAEEVGELCGEVLAHNSLQRKEKSKRHNSEELSEEFADVIIVTLLLAKTMNINIRESLRKKIEKVDKRY